MCWLAAVWMQFRRHVFFNSPYLVADVVKFGAQNVSFSMLVASNLALGGRSSDAGGLGSTRKETLGFQAWISIDFGKISGPPFGRFWPTLAQQLCFLACVFAGHVF